MKKPKKGLTEAGLVFGISPKVHVQEYCILLILIFTHLAMTVAKDTKTNTNQKEQ